MTKIWVALESAIASFNAIVIAAYAHFNSCREANEENADQGDDCDVVIIHTVQLSSSANGVTCTVGPCLPEGGDCGCCVVVLRI
ncbi:MAG: hypothetical protein JZU67_04800, partial [Burkholderiaceae bacterium]|nr:hypothetical protein [Burkholderiaceae bacterium]